MSQNPSYDLHTLVPWGLNMYITIQWYNGSTSLKPPPNPPHIWNDPNSIPHLDHAGCDVYGKDTTNSLQPVGAQPLQAWEGSVSTSLYIKSDSMVLFCSGCHMGPDPATVDFNAAMAKRNIPGKIRVRLLPVQLPKNLCGELVKGIPCSERSDTVTTDTEKGNTGIMITGHEMESLFWVPHKPCTEPSPDSGNDYGDCFYTSLNSTDACNVLITEVTCLIATLPQYKYVGEKTSWKEFVAKPPVHINIPQTDKRIRKM